jgi:hypothetical protein
VVLAVQVRAVRAGQGGGCVEHLLPPGAGASSA